MNLIGEGLKNGVYLEQDRLSLNFCYSDIDSEGLKSNTENIE